jgi:acyl carrier protein
MNPETQSVTDEAVLRVVRSSLRGVRNVDRIEVQTDLWSAGMDSLANIAVMVAVEDAFGIEFTDEFLTREVFASAANIADAVRSLQPTPHEGS